MASNRSEVAKFYDGKSIFITGATGFVGKVLIEKLLYSCCGIKQIYVLIRNRNSNDTIHNRYSELLKCKVFERLKADSSDVLSKIIPIAGDTRLPSLGLSESDEKLISEEVSVFFHAAALVRFDDPLKIAIEHNLVGTKNVFDLFKKCKSPSAFVYVSTAFSNCHRERIEEIVYPSAVDPNFMLEVYRHLDEKAMESLKCSVADGRPNSYTTSKALAESYLEENHGKFPVVIVRPSIVSNSINEPIKGWTDQVGLLTMLIRGIIMGLVHNIPANGSDKLDLVPVDLLCNLMITLAWWTSSQKQHNGKTPVYHCVSSTDNYLTFYDIRNVLLSLRRCRPSMITINWPYTIFTKNVFLTTFNNIHDHYLPALMVDFFRILGGKGPMYFSSYRRYFKTFPLKAYFLEREFNFVNHNAKALRETMSPTDQKVFNFNNNNIIWSDYMYHMLEGILFLVFPREKEDIPKAKRKYKMLFLRWILMNAFFALVGLYIIANIYWLLCKVLIN